MLGLHLFLFLTVFFSHEVNGICFVETPWEYMMERLVSDTYVNMTAELCMEGCLSLASCTGISHLGRVCILLGSESNVSASCFPTTYLKRTPGCVNPASIVSLKLGDAVGTGISFVYNVWANAYTFAGKTVAGVLKCVKSSSNVQFIYETYWKCKYINRINFGADGLVNYQIDFPAEQVSSISVRSGSNGLFGGSTVDMRACSWTICQDIAPDTPYLLEPSAGSILSSPFRFSITLKGSASANVQAYRYMWDASNSSPKNLEIVFNLK